MSYGQQQLQQHQKWREARDKLWSPPMRVDAPEAEAEVAPIMDASDLAQGFQINASVPPAKVRCGPKGWSDEQITELRRLVQRPDMSARLIANELGISRNAVIGKVSRLGLKLPNAPCGRKYASRKEGRRRASQARKERRACQAPTGRPTPAVVVAQLSPLNIPLLDLCASHCREITGHGADNLATFCGHEKSSFGTSFCEFHKQKNYNSYSARP